MQNVLVKHEMFEEIGGGGTRKQGQEVESVSCQANNVGQFCQALNLLKINQSVTQVCAILLKYVYICRVLPPPPPHTHTKKKRYHFNSQCLHLFGFSISVSFVWCVA